MDALLAAYDRWNGLIPFLGGIYATLLAHGYLPRKPKNPERLALWRKKFGPMMRILGPIVILVGIVTLVTDLTKEDPIKQTIRELNAAPKMVDQVTRFDSATAGPGQRITVEETIVTMNAADISRDAWEKFLPQLRQNISNSKTGMLTRKGVTVVYRYFGKDAVLIDEVVLTPADLNTK
jgi:hypothetical protein